MQTQIKELYQPLFLYVKKRVNNNEDAEDLTQEVFYKLSKSKVEDVNNVKNWVYTIAKNTITDYYRKKKVQVEAIDERLVDETYHEDNVVPELSGCVAAFLKQLPEEYRSIMTLSELNNIPQKDIAKQLGMNYTTVRSKVQRGRKKLKEIFATYCTVTQGAKGSILDCEQNNCNSETEPNSGETLC
ncbi:MAG TPA: RNA polymerase subunit sigma-70 [Microscillaceae bacterium]|nr:RNA polymerase subunit sigma-70 [Microscillaceae bacterium]